MPGERTEQATAHRREKAKKEGDILYSRELTAATGTLAGVLALGAVGKSLLAGMQDEFAAFLALGTSANWETDRVQQTLAQLRSLALLILQPSAFVMSVTVIAALLAAIFQSGGVRFYEKSLGLKFSRLNVIKNLQNLVSLRTASRLGKSLIPVGILLIIAVQRIAHQLSLPPFSLAHLETLGEDIYKLLLAASWLLFGWSAIDYLVEWQSRESRLKMSRQEIREEVKQTEGSPQIKGRIRNLQRQMRRRKVKEDVSKAAVVLTNPTHYAVALGFDFKTMDAPRVLAKGRNLLAEEIKAEARWSGVPVIENPPLARSLYRNVEIGQAIPTDLYAAVASILAYLYRQRVEQEMREQQASVEKK